MLNHYHEHETSTECESKFSFSYSCLAAGYGQHRCVYLNNSVSPGANLIFTNFASGTAPLHYQWQFNQLDLPGKTSTSLALTNVQLTNAGEYAIVVTNVAGVTRKAATLSVDPTFTKITTGPIATHPTSQAYPVQPTARSICPSPVTPVCSTCLRPRPTWSIGVGSVFARTPLAPSNSPISERRTTPTVSIA